MVQIYHDVEFIIQKQNPICWVACCAMLKNWATQSSLGVGEFTGGFDPANSCIANLANNWQQCTDLMKNWGFSVYSISQLSTTDILTANDIEFAISGYGPAVLLHNCRNFPYGDQWGDKDQTADLDILLQKINDDAHLGKTLGFWSDYT